MWLALSAAVLVASVGPTTLFSDAGTTVFAVEADTGLILSMVRGGTTWPGIPVLVATSGPARVTWAAPEAPIRLDLPRTAEVAEPFPVASVDGEGLFRNQHVSRVLVQHVQPAHQGWYVHRRVIVTVTFPPSSHRGPVDPMVDRILGPLVVNRPPWGGAPRSSVTRRDPPPEPSCKIVVDHRGLYRVTHERLAQAGVSLHDVPSASLRLWYHGLEQAFRVEDGGDGRFGAGDAIVFFGDQRVRDDPAGRAVPYVSQYSRDATYWLSWGGQPGVRWSTEDATVVPGDPDAAWYCEWVHAEEENVIFIGDHNEAFNNEIEWYWQQMNASTVLRQFSVPVDAVASADTFVLRIGLQGGSSGPGHHSQFFVTGAQVGEAWWGESSGRDALVFDSADSGMALPVSLLRTPTTTVGLKELPDGASGTAAYTFLNWIELAHPRRYVARGGTLTFAGPEGSTGQRHRFAVQGVAGENARIVNVTRAHWLAGASLSGDSLVFCAAAAAGDLLWLQDDSVPDTVKAIIPYTPVDPPFDSPARAADYVVITHPTLVDAADSMAVLAEAQGLRTSLASVDDLYDCFSWGEIHPDGIRDFLVCAYENWQPPALSSLLLLGDACWDFLGVSGPGTPPNLVPTWGNPGNDFFYSRLTQSQPGVYDWVPDIAVGRLPARDPAEAMIMVRRHAQALSGQPTSKNVLLVAHGSSDWEHASFASLSDYLAAYNVPGEMLPVFSTVYADPEGTPGPRSYKDDFVGARKQSPLLIHFLGRGDFYTWCMELHTTMPDTLTAPAPAPFLIGGSCHSGRFAMPDSSCLGEVELRASAFRTGSVGMVSSTGITAIGQAYLWSQYALPVLLSRTSSTVGDGFLAGVLAAGDFLSRRYALLADPTLRLPRPALPDLTVPEQWLEVSPTEPTEADPAISLAVRVVNRGCSALGGPDSCWVDIADSSVAGETALARCRVGLPSRAETTLAIAWSPPPGRGIHRISVLIDRDDACGESDETNNRAHRDVMVRFAAPDAVAPGDGGIVRGAVQLVVESLPNEVDLTYRCQVASSPLFGDDEILFEAAEIPTGEFHTVVALPALPERAALYWRCRGEEAAAVGAWSAVRSFEIDRLAPSGGWRQRHWGQFAADSLVQCRVDTTGSSVQLATAIGPDIARADSGASVVAVSSTYPGSNPAALIGPSFFIFANNDYDQTATIDLGRVCTLGALGAEIWSGAMDRGVWSRLELALSAEGTTFTPWVSYGVYPTPNVEIPARVIAGVDPAAPARYIRARFGAGCPHPGVLWGSRVYEIMAYPLRHAPEGLIVGPSLGPASRWVECGVEGAGSASDSLLLTVMGYELESLSWVPLAGLANLPAPGSWSLGSVDPAAYPWIRLEARLSAQEAGDGPILTEWSVLFAPR